MSAARVRVAAPAFAWQGEPVAVGVEVTGVHGVEVRAAWVDLVARTEAPRADLAAGARRPRLARLLTGSDVAHQEQVLARVPLPLLPGGAGPGTQRADVTVAVDSPPTSVGRRLALTTRLRATLDLGPRTASGDAVVWVRRRPAPPASPVPTGRRLDGPSVVLWGPGGPGAPVDGPIRRPLEVATVVLAGAAAVPAGRLEIALVRHTRRSPLVAPTAPPALADDVVARRRLRTPPLGAGGSHHLPPVTLPGPTSQSSTGAGGSVGWSVDARWAVGGDRHEASVDVIGRVALGADPPAPRRHGGHRSARRRGG